MWKPKAYDRFKFRPDSLLQAGLDEAVPLTKKSVMICGICVTNKIVLLVYYLVPLVSNNIGHYTCFCWYSRIIPSFLYSLESFFYLIKK